MKNLEKYYINFDELKKGDTVWHSRLGETEISVINNNSKNHPIVLTTGCYTKEGKFADSDKYPTIYKSNPFLDLKEEPRMIEVRLDKEIWEERELIYEIKGSAVVWSKKRIDIPEVYCHMFWREIQPKELTDKERIAKLEEEIEKLKNKVNGKIL